MGKVFARTMLAGFMATAVLTGPALRAADPAGQTAADPALQAAIGAKLRPAADTVRDRFRHPYETLQFWGIKPGVTVVDLQPEGGYWTEILAPYWRRRAASI